MRSVLVESLNVGKRMSVQVRANEDGTVSLTLLGLASFTLSAAQVAVVAEAAREAGALAQGVRRLQPT